MGEATENVNPSSSDDKLLEMFFDESFVPQAFVDILLLNTASKDNKQLQQTAPALLSRLDFYTRHLTSELENTIWNLERLSDVLVGTWNMPSSAGENSKVTDNESSTEPEALLGASKLEYYLDTLSNAVRTLKNDTCKVDERLHGLDEEYKDGMDVVEELRNLEGVKERLNDVMQYFTQVRTISEISKPEAGGSPGGDQKGAGGHTVSLRDLEVSLTTLSETIGEALLESSKQESSMEKNVGLLHKIDQLVKLAPLFKGFDPFYKVFVDFSNNILKKREEYLEGKDINEEDLTVRKDI